MLQRALTVFDTSNLIVDVTCGSEEGRKTYESVGFVALDEGCRSRANQRLLAAAERGMIDDVQALVTGPDVNARTEDGKTALTLARENGYEQVAECLIAHGGKE